jgi:hypothetical protein
VNFAARKQFPPLMIIYKRPADGTMQFNGVALEILDYTAKALDIRKVVQINYH